MLFNKLTISGMAESLLGGDMFILWSLEKGLRPMPVLFKVSENIPGRKL
jgi:hypothetical protein